MVQTEPSEGGSLSLGVSCRDAQEDRHPRGAPKKESKPPGTCTCEHGHKSGRRTLPGPALLLQVTWTARHGSQAGGIQSSEVQQEVVVSYLPLSHIAAQIYDLWTPPRWGAQVCFADPDALQVSLPWARVGVRACVPGPGRA